MYEKRIAKCPKCNSNNYIVVSEASNREGHLQLRQCNECYMRYRVLILIDGNEANL